MHDRRDGVEEGERVFAGERADRGGEIGRGERAGGDDDAVPFVGRQRHFAAHERDERLRSERRRHGGGKSVAIDRQCAAGRHLVASAARITSEPSRRISACSRPTAL